MIFKNLPNLAEYSSMLLIIITLIISVIVVVKVLIDRAKHKDDSITYSKKRTLLVYSAIISGYLGSIINHSLQLNSGEELLSTFLIELFFYLAVGVVITFLAFKKPVKKENGTKEITIDYHSVQFIMVLLFGFTPLLLVQ